MEDLVIAGLAEPVPLQELIPTELVKLLHGGKDSVPGWADIATRVIETSGNGPIDAFVHGPSGLYVARDARAVASASCPANTVSSRAGRRAC